MPKSPIAKNCRDIDEIIGANCRSLRHEAGCSLEHLAAGLGLTYQQVQKYETGRNRIAASTLFRIAIILEVPVLSFYEGLPLQPSPSRVSHYRVEIGKSYESLSAPMRLHVRGIIEHLAIAARGIKVSLPSVNDERDEA